MKTQILEQFKDSNRKEEEDEEDIEAGKIIVERRFRLWKERIVFSKKRDVENNGKCHRKGGTDSEGISFFKKINWESTGSDKIFDFVRDEDGRVDWKGRRKTGFPPIRKQAQQELKEIADHIRMPGTAALAHAFALAPAPRITLEGTNRCTWD
jgi:hypothetical protein